MKHKIWLLALLGATTLVAGCDKDQTASQQIDQVQAETKQAAQDMKDYTYAHKAEFVQSMQNQLAALDKDLEKLAVKIDNSSDALKAEAKPKLQDLRDQAAKLDKQLADAQNATQSTWDSVKDTTKTAYASLQTSFTNARQWVSDKIAP